MAPLNVDFHETAIAIHVFIEVRFAKHVNEIYWRIQFIDFVRRGLNRGHIAAQDSSIAVFKQTISLVTGEVRHETLNNAHARRVLAQRPFSTQWKDPDMGINKVPSGNIPQEINVIIEIPAHADPIKYEVDKASGAIFVDRFMGTSMSYPCNYGYVPQTISGDGDPVDVLVVAPFALIPGVVIRCRPVGLLRMKDESGIDAKVLAVPIDAITPLYEHIVDYLDMPLMLLRQIEHFFQHYKDLELGKWVEVLGWEGVVAASNEICEGQVAYGQCSLNRRQ